MSQFWNFFLPVLKALHSDKNAKHYKLEFKQFTTIELNLKKGGMSHPNVA